MSDGPPYIVTEFAAKGNLKHILEQMRHEFDLCEPHLDLCLPKNVNNLVRFAFQVASGMAFLASKRVIKINVFLL